MPQDIVYAPSTETDGNQRRKFIRVGFNTSEIFTESRQIRALTIERYLCGQTQYRKVCYCLRILYYLLVMAIVNSRSLLRHTSTESCYFRWPNVLITFVTSKAQTNRVSSSSSSSSVMNDVSVGFFIVLKLSFIDMTN